MSDNKITIAIIEPNDIVYDQNSINHNMFDRDKILDIMEEHVLLKEVSDKDQIMEIILNSVGTKDVFPIHTSNVSNVDDDLYQMCHIYLTEETYNEIKKTKLQHNGIASYFSDTGLKVYGKTVMLKIDTHDNLNRLCGITHDNIAELFIKKFVHQGVVLNVDGHVDEHKYIFNPIDWIAPSDVQNYRYDEICVLDKVMMIFFNINSDEEENKTIELVLNKKIKGRTIIALRNHYQDINDNNNVYYDLDRTIFNKMLKLIKNNDDSILNSSYQDTENINGKTVFTNFHKIINSKNI